VHDRFQKAGGGRPPVWLPVDLVTGIWSTNSNEKLILGSNVADDIAFAFAPVLSTDQYIDKRRRISGI
jgi:hypothetical protein